MTAAEELRGDEQCLVKPLTDWYLIPLVLPYYREGRRGASTDLSRRSRVGMHDWIQNPATASREA